MRPQSKNQLGLFGTGTDELWSYSRLKSLRRCALEYKVRWVDGQEILFQPQSGDVQAGRLLHRIVHEYYHSEPFTDAPHHLLEIYKMLAPHSQAWTEDLRGEPRVLDVLRVFSLSQVARFRAEATEVRCRAHLGGVRLTGQADLIYHIEGSSDALGILEFKLNDVEVRADDPAERFLQCIVYYLGLPEQFRRLTQAMGVYVFDSGKFCEIRIEQTLIDRGVRIIESTLARAKGPEFPPTVNAFCSSCGYRSLCPAYRGTKI